MSNIGIRNVAAKIMVEICNGCDYSLKFDKLDVSHISEQRLILKAITYLTSKEYISVKSVGTPIISGHVTANGIDWVEDYLETHSGI